MVAPDATFPGMPSMIGDETVLPTFAGTLEGLTDWPDKPNVQVFEVSHETDQLELRHSLEAQVN